MAVDLNKICHPNYLNSMVDYKKIRDCFKGERAIKAEGPLYLPQLSAQSMGDYNNYKTRALFFPITGKTVSSMVGLATTKPPKLVFPKVMEAYFQDTETDEQFTETYLNIFQEVILMGRYGVLIDAPPENPGPPILAPYIAENILNWNFSGGKLRMVLLREHYSTTGEDRFETVVKCRYRHLYINAAGQYEQEVLDDDLKTVSLLVPTFSGNPIEFIPFTVFGSSGVHISVDKPPMLDISTINISHYLSSADLEWGRHMVGLPTPVVSGVDSSTNLKIGGTAAWILPAAEAKAYYLEFQGLGLNSLEKALSEKIGLMASMSARLIDNSTRGSEAAETVRLRYMSESASLIHIIASVENGAMIVYNMLAKLLRATGGVSIKFSREVLGVGITFKDLAIMFEAYLAGSISKETLVYNMRRLEAMDPDRTNEEEMNSMRDPPPIEGTETTATKPTPSPSRELTVVPNQPTVQQPSPTQVLQPTTVAPAAASTPIDVSGILASFSQIVSTMAAPQPINVVVNMPEQKPPIVSIRPQPVHVQVDGATINVAQPEINVAAPDITIESPTFNLSQPDVKVDAPQITVSPPTVNVEAPNITVEAPKPPVVNVTVERPNGSKQGTLIKQSDGTYTMSVKESPNGG